MAVFGHLINRKENFMDNTANNIFVLIIKKIDWLFSFVSRLCYGIGGILLVGITLIIFAGVINRSFFSFPWLFVEEYSSLALIPLSYLAMGYTLRWNQHLKMDLVIRNVPDRLRQILGIFAAVFSAVCIIYMVYASYKWFMYTVVRHVTSSGTLRTPLWIISGTMAIGILLFAIDMGLLIIHRVVGLITGKSLLKFVDDDPNVPREEESLL